MRTLWTYLREEDKGIAGGSTEPWTARPKIDRSEMQGNKILHDVTARYENDEAGAIKINEPCVSPMIASLCSEDDRACPTSRL